MVDLVVLLVCWLVLVWCRCRWLCGLVGVRAGGMAGGGGIVLKLLGGFCRCWWVWCWS